ncbi:hypothetical protein [Pandoraea cepalis]|uniref:hypothetical protein n=1 Tax=Pandoraea cepalis TaxID=2508294 RepID=UPI00263ABD71|nr:hypothetical protein [Pandoraea cepalis]
MGDVGHVAGHDFSIKASTATGVRGIRQKDVEQRADTAADMAAAICAPIAPAASIDAGNGTMMEGAMVSAPATVSSGRIHTSRWLRCTAGAILFAAVSSGVVATVVSPSAPAMCHYDGKTYSIGSLIVVYKTSGRECRIDDDDHASWYPVPLN